MHRERLNFPNCKQCKQFIWSMTPFYRFIIVAEWLSNRVYCIKTLFIFDLFLSHDYRALVYTRTYKINYIIQFTAEFDQHRAVIQFSGKNS